MRNVDLYIVAAGNGSRMKAGVPKALVPITDLPCLTSTLQQISAKFRRSFIVTNVLVRSQWEAYFSALRKEYPELTTALENIPIESGKGDGHATLEALRVAERMQGPLLARDVVIVWGDVFIPNSALIDELLTAPSEGAGLIPVVRESNPYVSLFVDERMRCISADFSKLGERHASGYHDQSVFRFDRVRLTRSLTDLHNALWKNGRYIAPNSELSLLYAFHYLYNVNDPVYVYETAYPTLSFNTVAEVAEIQRAISVKWQERTRQASVGLHDSSDRSDAGSGLV